MTLVLSGTAAYHVFHASDRLTTITPTLKNPDRAWDVHASKTVIVCGSDCWLVIGYTGLAYLDDKPTDAFIASVLAGGADLTGMGMWFPDRPLHYREITRSVEAAVLEAYSRLPAAVRDHGTIVSGVGVQKRRPRPRHVAFRAVITRHGISHIELAERCQPRTRFSYNAIGSYDRGILDRMRTRLRAEGLHSPERFRDIMAVRVGSFGEETAKIPNISTPYILAPGQFFSPAVASGGFHLYPSNVVIELTGFDREPAPGPLRAFWGAHPRRAQPT